MEQIKDAIKNKTEVERLLAEGWEVDEDQDNNPGQINNPDNDTEYYDAETDTFHTI